MISPHLLYVDASYSAKTYLEWLIGIPSPKKMIESAQKKAKELWGEHPTFIIEPTIKPTIKGKKLPKWVHMVWAGGPAMDEKNDASELVIIWWSEMGPDTDRVLNAVPWEKHAKDYQI